VPDPVHPVDIGEGRLVFEAVQLLRVGVGLPE
jgi:hypothetical protein